MEKQMKKYLSQVKRRLNLPREIRERLLSDLETSIAARAEQREDWETIRENLGSPSQVAAEYMEQMKEFAYRKSPWRFLPLAVAVLCGLRFLENWVLDLASKVVTDVLNIGYGTSSSVGIIGSADGPTAVFITRSPALKLWMVVLIFVISLIGYFRLRKCKNSGNSKK